MPGSTTPTSPSCSPSARNSRSPNGPSGGSCARPRSVRPGPVARHATGAAGSGCHARASFSGRRQSTSLVRTRRAGRDAGGRDRRRDRAGARRHVPGCGGRGRLLHDVRPDGRAPRPAGGRLLRSPRDLQRRAQPGPDPHRAAERQAQPDPGRAGPRRGAGRLDRGALRAGQGPGRAAVGGRSRTGSSRSSASRGSARSRRPMRSCPDSSIATTRGSPSRPPTRCPPGGHGPTASPRRRSSASPIRDGSAGTTRSAGRAAISPCRAGATDAAGSGDRSSSRSASTAARGSATTACACRSGRPRPTPADPGQLRARRLSRPTEDRPELDLGLLAPAPPAERRASRPAADHPWRRRYSERGR